MYNSFYPKLFPILFGILGFILGLGCYLAETSPFKSNNHLFYWSVFFTLQAAVGLFIGLLIQRLHNAAFTDGLTGLWNYRFFYKTLTRQLTVSNDSACCLIYLDLDNLKSINDTNGHQLGDEILCRLAKILRQNCRATDVIARLGGDEFAIILPNTTLAGAIDVAERIRKTTEKKFTLYRSTISAGVAASWPKADADRLISSADQALYRAKNSKNIVIYFPQSNSDVGCTIEQ